MQVLRRSHGDSRTLGIPSCQSQTHLEASSSPMGWHSTTYFFFQRVVKRISKCIKPTEHERERQELTAYLIWHVWKARNSWAYNASKASEHEVVQKAIAAWTEFKDSQLKRE